MEVEEERHLVEETMAAESKQNAPSHGQFKQEKEMKSKINNSSESKTNESSKTESKSDEPSGTKSKQGDLPTDMLTADESSATEVKSDGQFTADPMKMSTATIAHNEERPSPTLPRKMNCSGDLCEGLCTLIYTAKSDVNGPSMTDPTNLNPKYENHLLLKNSFLFLNTDKGYTNRVWKRCLTQLQSHHKWKHKQNKPKTKQKTNILG